MIIQAIAIIRKELREALRTTRIYLILIFIFSTYLQWFIVRNYVGMAKDPSKSQLPESITPDQILLLAPTFSLIFVAPIVIPFFANTILSRSLIRERFAGSLITLFSTGVNPGLVWGSKVVAAFLYSYPVALGCIGLDLLMIKYYFNLPIAWSLTLVVTVLIIAPVASLAIIAIMSFLFWTVRPAHFIASFLPVIVSLGLFAYASAHPVTEVLVRGVLIVTMVSAGLLGACGFAISKLNRQFIAGL
jgi:hypothetical protein